MRNRLLAALALLALIAPAHAQEQYGAPVAATPPAAAQPQPVTLVPPLGLSWGGMQPGGTYGLPVQGFPLMRPLKVDPLPLANGQGNIGNVGGKTREVCVAPTVTAANAYGVNFVVGGLLTFQNAFTSTGTGILQSVVVTIKDLETSGFVFIPFAANPSATTWTDAAVAALNAADVTKTRGAVPLASNTQLAASAFSTQYAYGIGEPIVGTSTSLWGVLLANAALTNNFAAATDVQVCVEILQDL